MLKFRPIYITHWVDEHDNDLAEGYCEKLY